MEETRFLISETAKRVEVETHVLRYWEEELELPIKRNELGHRYYTKDDIERFREVKRLKEKGLQLRAIKTMLYNQKEDTIVVCNPTKEEKSIRLQMLLKHIISEAVRETNSMMVDEIKDSVVKELDYQFRIFGEEEEKRASERIQKEEEHFRKLDELIRGTATKGSKRKKHSIF